MRQLVTLYISYFFIAVIKHHTNQLKEGRVYLGFTVSEE